MKQVLRGTLLAGAGLGGVALAGSMLFGVGSGALGARPADVLGVQASSAAACSGAAFCITTPSPGPVLAPGAPAAPFPVTLTNPLPEQIVVTSLTVQMTAGLPVGCLGSDFSFNGTRF